MFKTEYVFARILLPFTVGISLFYFFPNKDLIFILETISFILLLSLITINAAYKKLTTYYMKGFIGVFLFLLFFVLGGLFCLLNNETLNSDYFGKAHFTHLKIYIKDEPQETNGILRFKAKVLSGYENYKQIRLTGQLLVALKIDTLNPIKLKYGDEVIFQSNCLEVEPPYNPTEFDFKAWLASQNVYQQTFIDQSHLIKTNNNFGNPILKFAINLKEKQIIKYRKLIKNDEAFAIASTLILGYRADLSKEILAVYSKTGTIHALSVSGSHVAIIFFVLDFCLVLLDRKRILRILKLVLICCLIWSYALITGLSPSVVRAAIMITIFITAKTFSRNKNAYNILAFAAFCQLVYNPFLIWDVGFQLSYISVFGLIYLQPKIYKWMYVENKWLNKIWELIALSLSAQLITFPLSIYYFHQFPVYFLLGNLFISIPLIIIMILGLLVLIAFMDRLSPIFEWIILSTNTVLKWIADLPFSTFSSIWINLTELILLCLALGLFTYALSKFNKKYLFYSLSVFIVYQTIIILDDWKTINQKKIIFFTLRKNYAAAFIHGRKTILLSNMTPQDKNYQFFVKPALEQAKIDKIDFIDLNKDTVLDGFILKNKQIIFYKYNTLVIDDSFNHKKLNLDGQFSSIWLHGNTKFKLDKMNPKIRYKSIVIDASNKDYNIKSFEAFAKKIKVDTHILKKNKAYLVELTP